MFGGKLNISELSLFFSQSYTSRRRNQRIDMIGESKIWSEVLNSSQNFPKKRRKYDQSEAFRGHVSDQNTQQRTENSISCHAGVPTVVLKKEVLESSAGSPKSADDVVISESHANAEGYQDEDSDSSFGPQPIHHSTMADKRIQQILVRQGLFKGEAEGMAAFARDGKRIPRRGEIGMDASQIEKLENIGYVMSGNRNKRMNAIRIEKEQKVLNLEKDRIASLQKIEQKFMKEHEQLAEFREILSKQNEKIFETGIMIPHNSEYVSTATKMLENANQTT
eukprot:GDKJ01041359.1.p1 GENE.GDKJ01041359.1~~GDKJ01041359.1.p1  ORF type:complete len:279 (-),score=44.48 GDKJ01041359.1:238-1074(-)